MANMRHFKLMSRMPRSTRSPRLNQLTRFQQLKTQSRRSYLFVALQKVANRLRLSSKAIAFGNPEIRHNLT